jgi:hypothetical protein
MATRASRPCVHTFRHQEDPVAAPFQRLAHEAFALAVVILPGVVHEGDAGVDGGVHDADGGPPRLDLAEVVPAKAERRHLHAGGAQRAHRNRPRHVFLLPGLADRLLRSTAGLDSHHARRGL